MAITPVKELVAAAKSKISNLSVEEVSARLNEGTAQLVDIRDIRELQKTGRLPGAIHAPRGMLEFWVDPQSPYHRADLSTDKTLILVCASSWRSALAAQTLQNMGVLNVAELEGGVTAWSEAGLPLEAPSKD